MGNPFQKKKSISLCT